MYEKWAKNYPDDQLEKGEKFIKKPSGEGHEIGCNFSFSAITNLIRDLVPPRKSLRKAISKL